MIAKIIGFTGRKGSGKNTLASMVGHKLFVRKPPTVVGYLSFAAPLKAMVEALLKHAMAYPLDVEAWKRRESEYPIKGVDKNVRQMLQTLGTEWGRSCIDKDLWVKVAASMVERESHVDVWLVTDVRFDNEAEWIKQQGGIIVKLLRDETEAHDGHMSEAGVAQELIDVVVPNNGGFDELRAHVDPILKLAGA